MSAHPSYSFRNRLLLIVGVVLVMFLLLSSVILEKSFKREIISQQEARLQAFVFSLLTAAEETAPGQIYLPEFMRDDRLNDIDSGLYGFVADSQGTLLWRSHSALRLPDPKMSPGPIGRVEFFDYDWQGLSYLAARSDVIWESMNASETRYTLLILETTRGREKAVNSFRNRSFRWLGFSVIALLIGLFVLMRWGLQPLRAVSSSLKAIESGKKEYIEGSFPDELRPLTDNINFFIRTEREQRKRYSDAMGNLAHSLKTPLAVLNTVIERERDIEEMRGKVREQVVRMNDIVRYQLQKSITKGRSPLSASSNVAPLLAQTIQAMEKVHGIRRGIHFELIAPAHVRFIGETGDFMEILGNLLDNAGKWAVSHVRCHVSETGISGGRHALHLDIEDDGPGIAKDLRLQIIARGERLDEKVEGQGIGLSVVSEMVAAYQGRLEFGTSPELGGAWVHIELPL